MSTISFESQLDLNDPEVRRLLQSPPKKKRIKFSRLWADTFHASYQTSEFCISSISSNSRDQEAEFSGRTGNTRASTGRPRSGSNGTQRPHLKPLEQEMAYETRLEEYLMQKVDVRPEWPLPCLGMGPGPRALVAAPGFKYSSKKRDIQFKVRFLHLTCRLGTAWGRRFPATAEDCWNIPQLLLRTPLRPHSAVTLYFVLSHLPYDRSRSLFMWNSSV